MAVRSVYACRLRVNPGDYPSRHLIRLIRRVPRRFFVSFVRRSAGFAGAFTLVLALGGPAAAASRSGDTTTRLVIETLRMPTSAAQVNPANVGAALPPCSDTAHLSEGAKQAGTYRWSFKASTTPAGLSRSGVTAILQKSFANVTGAHNDCGRSDNVGATSQYLGTTSRSPNCNSQDGQNVVAFGPLASGVLAVTCFWVRGGTITEADMKITTAESWALSLATCHGNMPLLESTITHEAGHVFGLAHVGERAHGRLTMSPYIDGVCEDNETTLGLGDMLGLESMY